MKDKKGYQIDSLTKYIRLIINFLKSKNFLEYLIILLSIVTVNFVVYIIQFNFNILILVDSVAISNYTFEMLLLYALISLLSRLVFKYIFNMFLILPTYAKVKNTEEDSSVIFLLGKLENVLADKLFRIMINLMIFSYFFTGFMQTITTTVFMSIITYLWFYIERAYIKFAISTTKLQNNINDNTNNKKFIDYIKLMSTKKELTLKQFMIDNIGVLLILLSFIIGNARADYVKNNIHININNDTKRYTLYLTTATGIGIYNNETQETLFISWDNIKHIKFLKSSKEHNKTLEDE